MVTVMIHAKIKPARLNEYLDLITMLTEKTTRKGAITYSFNQNKAQPTEFVLYEQWQTQQALESHIEELFELLGPAKQGDMIPEKLMELYESAIPVYYDVLT